MIKYTTNLLITPVQWFVPNRIQELLQPSILVTETTSTSNANQWSSSQTSNCKQYPKNQDRPTQSKRILRRSVSETSFMGKANNEGDVSSQEFTIAPSQTIAVLQAFLTLPNKLQTEKTLHLLLENQRGEFQFDEVARIPYAFEADDNQKTPIQTISTYLPSSSWLQQRAKDTLKITINCVYKLLRVYVYLIIYLSKEIYNVLGRAIPALPNKVDAMKQRYAIIFDNLPFVLKKQ